MPSEKLNVFVTASLFYPSRPPPRAPQVQGPRTPNVASCTRSPRASPPPLRPPPGQQGPPTFPHQPRLEITNGRHRAPPSPGPRASTLPPRPPWLKPPLRARKGPHLGGPPRFKHPRSIREPLFYPRSSAHISSNSGAGRPFFRSSDHTTSFSLAPGRSTTPGPRTLSASGPP